MQGVKSTADLERTEVTNFSTAFLFGDVVAEEAICMAVSPAYGKIVQLSGAFTALGPVVSMSNSSPLATLTPNHMHLPPGTHLSSRVTSNSISNGNNRLTRHTIHSPLTAIGPLRDTNGPSAVGGVSHGDTFVQPHAKSP